MSTISILLLIGALAYGVYKGLIEFKEEKETYESIEKQRKEELKELIESRRDREISEEYSEDLFWELIEKINKRAKNNYKNNLGILKDFLNKFSPEDLIKLDNLLLRFYRGALSHDLTAASTIIFKTQDIQATYLLMNVFILRGETFFNQAILNPNFIIGKEVQDVDGVIINDIIDELYFLKTKELIPLNDTKDIEIKGNPWKEKELPSRYPELWSTFA